MTTRHSTPVDDGTIVQHASANEREHTLGGLHIMWLTVWHIAQFVVSTCQQCDTMQPTADRGYVLGFLASCYRISAIKAWSVYDDFEVPAVLLLMPFSHPQKSLHAIWSTCRHSALLATLVSSSHSIPRCHGLLFQPTLSQLLIPGPHSGPVHCWTFSSLIFLALGLIWNQMKLILALGLMMSHL